MNCKLTIILPFLTLCTVLFYGQSSNSRFAQFMLTNVDSRDKMVEIDQFMRNQQGVEISRADIVSKKYLCIYDPSSGIDKELFEKWMQKLGVEIKCFREGKYGTDKIIDQKMDCE